jgi:hypothetical protein
MDEKSPDLRHGADRDSHFLAAPSMSLLEEHAGYMVAAGLHDQSLDLPYIAVGRTDGELPAYLYLAERNGVDGDLLRGFRLVLSGAGTGPGRPGHPESCTGHKVDARGQPGVVGPGGVEVRYDLSLFGGLKRLELGQGAAKLDLTRRSAHEVNGNKSPCATAVLLVDHDISDLPGGRVDDYAAHFTAGSIAATGVGPEPELHLTRHCDPSCSLDLNKPSQQQRRERPTPARGLVGGRLLMGLCLEA